MNWQPAQHLRPLGMSERGDPAAGVGRGDRPHGRRREQRIPDARDVDEKKRGAAGRHSNVGVAMRGLTMIPDSVPHTGLESGDHGPREQHSIGDRRVERKHARP